MNVLVVDDSELFPLHVWRYISRTVGIGAGEWPLHGENPPKLESHDGALTMWWVRADDGWRAAVAEVLARCESDLAAGGGLLVLLDIRGAKSSDYSAVAAHDLLIQYSVDPELIWMISAYDRGHLGSGHRVRPKARETLKEARDIILKRTAPGAEIPRPEVRHVLVTGAGFERRDSIGGFGFPSTADLLGAVDLEKLGRAMVRLAGAEANEGWFPVPRGGPWGDGNRPPKTARHLEDIARRADLDRYWDYFLKVEVDWFIDSDDTSGEREESKLEGVWQENALREAFRKVVRAYDWGHMNQSIDAARLDWSLWLTTNYTQFADRAIAVTQGRPKDGLNPWRIVSTASEARIAVREDRDKSAAEYRYLFKLHGDVGHLHTMAIAGHDKEVVSPLTVPIEDLSQVYAAAQRFLLNLVDRERVDMVVWHVVGHSLSDGRLRDLLKRTFRHREPKHAFLLINPKDEEFKIDSAIQPRVYRSPLYAADYLARLARAGFPPIPPLISDGPDRQDLDRLARWEQQARVTLTPTVAPAGRSERSA